MSDRLPRKLAAILYADVAVSCRPRSGVMIDRNVPLKDNQFDNNQSRLVRVWPYKAD